MTQRLEERHALIWQHEQVVAYDLAKILIQKPKVTVWIIMLPLLFLFFMQDLKKYKNGIRSFVDGFLKNKKIALDLASQARQAGSSLDKALAAFDADSRPEAAGEAALHEQQMREIDCLANHFHRLLDSDGRTYEELVRNAYGTFGKYQQFLDKLFDLEAAVIDTAMGAKPPQADGRDVVAQMKSATRHVRHQKRDQIFKS